MAYKGYYYLKLNENFFDSDELKILESMENGYLYSNILLKLYLKALKGEGKLMFNEYIPYDAKMLSTITGHNVDVVEKAIRIFQSMKLIEVLDNGTIYMLNIQKLIGSMSSEGLRKAEYRERINIEKEKSGTSLGQCPNININSNYNSISNYNIEKDNTNIQSNNINNNSPASELKENHLQEENLSQETTTHSKTSKEPKHKYGVYKNILLTDKELQKLKEEFDNWEEVINYVDEAIEMKGYKYKSHYLAIRKWFKDKDRANSIASGSKQRKDTSKVDSYGVISL